MNKIMNILNSYYNFLTNLHFDVATQTVVKYDFYLTWQPQKVSSVELMFDKGSTPNYTQPSKR